MGKLKNTLLLLFFILLCGKSFSHVVLLAEDTLLPATAMEFEVEDVKIVGNVYIDENALKLLFGIYKGNVITLPGKAISDGIKNLWRNRIFDEIEVSAQHISVSKATLTLVINVKEQPRLWQVKVEGVSKRDKEELRYKMGFTQGKFLTETLKGNAEIILSEFYRKKNCSVEITEVPVTAEDNCPKPKEYINLFIRVTKNKPEKKANK